MEAEITTSGTIRGVPLPVALPPDHERIGIIGIHSRSLVRIRIGIRTSSCPTTSTTTPTTTTTPAAPNRDTT
jgi:hypothetical protein